ncbi:S-layer homology domain-containing protein [Aminobacterium sp. EBM-42]|uniref:S-layer homology domain-containing protein n=1 Tax=Aminobacterium sp. EBM-42 TaxID=1918503 RepID=UPI000A988685|nr:S-layer homology domain-containing protein [Aminobacterium sp. EBM-42]
MKKILALVAVVALVAFAAPAFAANPFMDVPMNHWAYDAVGQLASRGVVSGYPDGSYKGNQPMTRYEMASLVARSLAVVDMEKASKQDVEMLKKLVVEFKDELDALGVKVDKLDGRVAVLEENLGGWKFWGEFRFDAKFADQADGLYTGSDVDFNLNRYRIWMSKKVDDKVKFTARLGNAAGNVAWQRYWIDVALPWDVNMMAGNWAYDWEDDDGLYADNDAWFTDRALVGFYFSKPFSMGEFAMYVTHDENNLAGVENYEYAARVKFNFNENFWLSGNYLMGDLHEFNVDVSVWWAAFGFNFNDDWALKGAYFKEDLDDLIGEKPAAWKAILDVKQEALGFTSLWLEYVDFDEGFFTLTSGPWDDYGAAAYNVARYFAGAPDLYYMGVWDNVLFVRLNQKWNDQWSTFQRYFAGDARYVGSEDTKNWTIGVKYYYTPALSFELAYDKIENSGTEAGNDDNVIRLRTRVTF